MILIDVASAILQTKPRRLLFMRLHDYFGGTPPPRKISEEAKEDPSPQSELHGLTWLMGEEIQFGMSIAVTANLIAEINKLEVAEI